MLKFAAHLGEPLLIPETDLRVTYAGADKPTLVERVDEDGAVLQRFLVAPVFPVFVDAPLGVDLRTWTVMISPDTTPDRASVFAVEGDMFWESRW